VIVLDTNVVSEVFKPLPSEKVLHWLAAQDDGAVATRNAADFERCGIRVINRWNDQPAKL
jgi:predicted nucleic acid-binding protein